MHARATAPHPHTHTPAHTAPRAWRAAAALPRARSSGVNSTPFKLAGTSPSMIGLGFRPAVVPWMSARSME